MVCDGSPGPPGQAQRAVVSPPVGRARNARHEQQAYPISDYQTTYGHEDRIQVLAGADLGSGDGRGWQALKGGYLPPGSITHIVIVIPWWHPRTLGCWRAGDGAIVALWLLAAVRAYRIHRRADGAIRPLLATHRPRSAWAGRPVFPARNAAFMTFSGYLSISPRSRHTGRCRCRMTSSPFHLDQADDHVLAALAGPLVQAVRHSPVEVPFHRHGAAFVACDLDQHDVGGVPDAEVLGADHEVGLVVLGDNHEPVVVWHVEHAGHGGVDHVGDGVPVPPRGLPRARSIRTKGIMGSSVRRRWPLAERSRPWSRVARTS